MQISRFTKTADDIRSAQMQLAVGHAIAQGFRVDPCAECGGPEIFSKTRPVSRCFRCGNPRNLLAIAQNKTSWRRCDLCRKQNMAGIRDSRYCRACQALSSSERAKWRRWATQNASDSSVGTKNDQ